MSRRICFVITARASYAKINPILQSLRGRDGIVLQIVCAASAVLERFGDTASHIISDGFQIDERLGFLLEGDDESLAAKSTGLGLIDFAGAFSRLRPHVVVLMADRYEVLSAAIAAAYGNIPVAHVQGGEVSGNIDEKVRHAITKLADFHFPATKRARDWIIKMGEYEDRVFMTGCPSIDIAKEVSKERKLSVDIYQKYGGVGSRPALFRKYMIVMQHAVTSESESASKQIGETLGAVIEFNVPTIWFWPNPDHGTDAISKTLRQYRETYDPANIHFIKNMEPKDFLRLLNHSSLIVGNSSAAIREASFLGIPAVNIGTRQSDRERGPNVIDVHHDKEAILNSIKATFNRKVSPSELYGQGDAGLKIANILNSIKLTTEKKLNY